MKNCIDCVTNNNPLAVKATYLEKHSYLSEFKTDTEKAKARHNLGIIKLSLDQYFNEIISELNNKIDNLLSQESDPIYSSSPSSEITETLVEKLKTFINAEDYVKLQGNILTIGDLTITIGDGKTNWGYSVSTSPSVMYYGLNKLVTWNYEVIPRSDSPNAVIIFNDRISDYLGTYSSIINSPKNYTIKIVNNGITEFTKSFGPTFNYKYFYYLSDSENTAINANNLIEFNNEGSIDCGDSDQYIYCLVRTNLIQNIGIKSYDLSTYDSNVFELISNYTLPAGTFSDLVNDVSGYYLVRTTYPLTGKWNIKF